MNWYQKLFSFLTKAHTPFTAVLRDRISTGLNLRDREYLKSYRGWVFACVNVIAQDIGDINLRLMKAKGEEDEEDEEEFQNPALETILRANSGMTKNELFQITSAHLDLSGNAFWYLQKDDKGIPIQIYPLQPERVKEIQDEDEPLAIGKYIYTQPSGAQVELDPSEIIPFRDFNPDGKYPFPTRGTGVVQAAAEIIDTDEFARKYVKNFYVNSARPDAILSYEGDMPAEELQRLKEEWNTEHRGTEKASKTAFLKGGMTYTPMSATHSQMELVESRRFTRDEILAMFRVPKSILGITEDVNRANAEASNFVFALRVLKPRMQKIVDTLNEFYLPLFGDDDIFFEFESPVPEDRVAILNEYTLGINKWLTRNEIRRREGLPDTVEGDTIFGTFGEIPTDRVKAVKKRGSRPRFKLKPLKERKEKTVSKWREEKKEDQTISESKKEAYGKLWVKQINVQIQVFRDELRKYFMTQEKAVLNNLDVELKGLEKKEFKLKQFEDFFDEDQTISAGIDLMKPFIRVFGKDAVQQSMLLTDGVLETIDFDSQAFQSFIDTRSREFAEVLTATTKKRLFTQLEQGFEAGENIEQLSKRVRGVFGNRREDFEIERIARTEINAISNFSTIESYKQLGIKKHEWLVANPEDTGCLRNAGVIRTIGKAFPARDSRGQQHTKPPVHPNCVCTTLPVV